MNQKQYLLGEAAKALGCQHYRITYMLATGQVPEPIRVGGRRVFTDKDLARIAEVLKANAAKKGQAKGGHHEE